MERSYTAAQIVNRTLVYSILTCTLGAIYLGSVGILQYLLSGLTGQTSPFSIIGSTLLIAVLFQPLHSSIQTVIERRSYRSNQCPSQAPLPWVRMFASILYIL
ncbi:MAG: hypothetical protein M3Z08_02945 [Chloroflexota bacterium]|nr:hypothetical protein [Chloroflexota bacterium]